MTNNNINKAHLIDLFEKENYHLSSGRLSVHWNKYKQHTLDNEYVESILKELVDKKLIEEIAWGTDGYLVAGKVNPNAPLEPFLFAYDETNLSDIIDTIEEF
jgi:hypothetical protein